MAPKTDPKSKMAPKNDSDVALLSSQGTPNGIKKAYFSPKGRFGSHLLDLVIYGRHFGTTFMDLVPIFIAVVGSNFMDLGFILRAQMVPWSSRGSRKEAPPAGSPGGSKGLPRAPRGRFWEDLGSYFGTYGTPGRGIIDLPEIMPSLQ